MHTVATKPIPVVLAGLLLEDDNPCPTATKPADTTLDAPPADETGRASTEPTARTSARRTTDPAQMRTEDLERVRNARSLCARSGSPDAWQPDATTIRKARQVGAEAITCCTTWCPVRAECLELEMRRGRTGHRTQHIRAGFTAGELREMRKDWLAGTSALDLLWPVDEGGAA